MKTSHKTVLLIGRPGSGKGTQAKKLAEQLGWKNLSTGDKFKELRDGAGALSDRVRSAYDAGQLLPDWFAAYLFENVVLNLTSEDGIVIEGYGRTQNQAEHLRNVVLWLGRELKVFHLNVSEDEALRRQVQRGLTEHRPDSDAEDKIRARFAEFTANTEPALQYFASQNMLTEINGELSPEEVAKEIEKHLST